MRRHPPREVDPERLRTLLASARARPDPPRRHGWIPEEEPPAADMSWLDESSVWDVGPALREEDDLIPDIEPRPVRRAPMPTSRLVEGGIDHILGS
jgi:hypothetical protein